MCVCIWMQEGARRSSAIYVGPMWLQRHSCKFIMDVRLETNDGRHVNAKWGKEQSVFRCLVKAEQGGIYM